MHIENYLDNNGKIKFYPTKLQKKLFVLNHLLSHFVYNYIYSEKEVNELIKQNISFEDYILIRRELIDNHLLKRTNNGSNYWRGDLVDEIETPNLLMRSSCLEDEFSLVEVNRSCQYIEAYIGEAMEDSYIHRILVEAPLPPNGFKEFYHCKSIIYKETQKIIGYLEYYQGYPNIKTCWIGNFLIHKDYQYQHLGSETIQAFLHELCNCHFEKVALGVHLKNWQGLRFWVKNGFDKIIKITGDKEYTNQHFSIVSLERLIN